MEEPGNRRETFITILGKFEEDKGGPVGVRSVERSGGSREETFVAALGPTAQVALRPHLLSLFLPDVSTNTLPKSVKETSGRKKTCAATSAKNDEGKSEYRAG